MSRVRVLILPVFALLLCACTAEEDSPPPDPGGGGGAAASLEVAAGTGWPKTGTASPDAQGLAVLQIVLETGDGGPVRVDAFGVRASGTVHEGVAVANGRLFVDDGDGLFDGTSDVPIGTSTFTGDDGILAFLPARTIPAGCEESWFVAVDLSGSGTTGQTVEVSVPDASYAGATDPAAGSVAPA